MSEEESVQTGDEWNVGQGDPHDRYPWSWAPLLDGDGGPTLGTISTPNGIRPDGASHTAWLVASNIWEPDGHLICALVNRWAHEVFGTPVPEGPDVDMIPMPERPLRVETYRSVEGHTTKHHQHRWRVVHTANGEIMASGEGYVDRRDRDHAVAVLFPGVEVVEVDG